MLDPYLDATRLRELVLGGVVSPREVAEFFLSRIEQLNPRLGAFMTVTAERALEDAARLERVGARQREAMPLFGVPYALKDMAWTAGIRTTFGSKNYEDFVPAVDAEYAWRLSRAGGILLGKTTTPEFGARPTTEGGLCPPARNPWSAAHSAGGSSGGAAVAVACGMAPLAQGSDGAGSIRIPAACCGVVGLKPARGRVTLSPVAGESWGGFGCHGPLARSVRDAALMLDVMAGAVVGDPHCEPPAPHPFRAAVELRPRGLKLAALRATSLATVDPEVGAAFEAACATLRAMGHEVEPIELDAAARLVEPSAVVMCAGVAVVAVPKPELMDPLVLRMRKRGLATSAAEYLRALTLVHNTARAIVQELAPYDALLTPTLPRPAVLLGALPSAPERYAEEAFAFAAFLFPFNATGQPAISLPNGFTSSGLPIGLQIVGRPNDEAGVLALAAAFEQARPWREFHPSLTWSTRGRADG